MNKLSDLRKWFNEEKWVDISRKNPDGSHPECGRDEAKLGKKGYPKCRPKAKAAQMTKKEKSYAVRAKRSKRQGVGGKPTMVPTEKPEKQTKTAMNLFEHFEIGLEKVAAQSGLNMTFDGLPRDIRKSIALNHAAMVANDHGTAADYHEAMGRRATKQNKTSVKKSEKPGVLSTIRHLGRQNAKTYHQGRAKSTAADMKLHSREFGKADKHANEHFNVLKSIVESNDRPKDQDRIISDYNKKHMKAKVRVSGSLLR